METLDNRFKLQFITDCPDAQETMAQVRQVWAGGCRFVQIRMKHAANDEIGYVLKTLCPEAEALGARLVVDDHVELAHLCHGVHLGRNDMSPAKARAILGPDKMIGVTVNDLSDIDRLLSFGKVVFDSIGLGPWRFTSTKEKIAPTLGLDGTRHLIEALRNQGIYKPVYAIGGITEDDLSALAQTGAYGIAISSAIGRSSSPCDSTKNFIHAIYKYLKDKN